MADDAVPAPAPASPVPPPTNRPPRTSLGRWLKIVGGTLFAAAAVFWVVLLIDSENCSGYLCGAGSLLGYIFVVLPLGGVSLGIILTGVILDARRRRPTDRAGQSKALLIVLGLLVLLIFAPFVVALFGVFLDAVVGPPDTL